MCKFTKRGYAGSIFLYTFSIYIFVALLTTSTKVVALPNEELSILCNTVALSASNRTGVPVSVLMAITLAETGRKRDKKFNSWPWTVNMEGKGVWFENKNAAYIYVKKEYERGARSFDVGCFQLNYKWHGHGFSSIEQMFDPSLNALYAAKFLKKLYIEKGNWVDAAGAYHSRTPKFANKYIERFRSIHSKILAKNLSNPKQPNSVKERQPQPSFLATNTNQLPLLQNGSLKKASLGSLLPVNTGSGPFWDRD